MKFETLSAAQPRAYRQSARAETAADTHRRIVDAFARFLKTRWLDDITLAEVAAAAGVTVQTVIRRFAGKEGLLRAAVETMVPEVEARRSAPAGSIGEAIAALMRDYEESGDLILRLLADEQRHPGIKPALDFGRRHHRLWVESVFAPWLQPLAPGPRAQRTTALVAATDVYLWKLMRRDLGLAARAARAVVLEMVSGLTGEKGAAGGAGKRTTP